MSKKLLISNSIMWAAAILIVAIVEEKQFAILMLVILATTSLMFLKKGNEQQKQTLLYTRSRWSSLEQRIKMNEDPWKTSKKEKDEIVLVKITDVSFFAIFKSVIIF